MSNDTSEQGCNPSRNTEARAGTQDDGDNTIVVLGIGNVLWADEGFGVRCVEALQAGWTFADHVQLIDDVNMATAATRGEAKPSMAMGTAKTL